jgi:DNA-binding GntR family transcriptional regulator
VVPRAPDSSSWAIRTVEDLIDRNLLERPRILSAASAAASAFPDYAALFGLGPRARLFVIERVSRGEPGQRAFYSVNAMPLETGQALSPRNIGREPLIVQIERARRVRSYRVRQDIRGGIASDLVARHLGIAAGSPTVIVRRTYFGWDGEAIVTADLHYRLDLFRQSIDLFREKAAD